MKFDIFGILLWIATTCSPVGSYRRFRGSWWLQPQVGSEI